MGRIRRIVLAEDNHRKTHLSTVSNVMENIDRHKALRLPSVGVVPVLVRHSVSSSALVPQLQFWLVFLRSVGVTFPVTRTRYAIDETH